MSLLLLLFIELLFEEHTIKCLIGLVSVNHIPRQAWSDLAQNASNIALKLSQLLEHWDELAQLVILLILVPTDAGHGIFWLK